MKEKTSILLADDDQSIRQLVQLYLEKEGYEVRCAGRGDDALASFRRFPPDLVLLDVMMPGADGVEVLKTIRRTSQIPVIMLTAKDETFDKVLCLELGADDYITKPFAFDTVLARVRAVLKRTQSPALTPSGSVIRIGALQIDPSRNTVSVGGIPVELTRREYMILCLMVQNPGIYFSREEIMSAVWPNDALVNDRSVDVHIARLRKKMGSEGRRLVNRTGFGYAFQN